MTKEEELLQKRIMDLAKQAYRTNRPVFSDFLNMNELTIYSDMKKDLSFIENDSFGGFSLAERKMIGFFPDGFEIDYSSFPIEMVSIAPLNKKFSDDLSHRDFLGALVNTGIDRCKLGDLIVDTNECRFFWVKSLANYFVDEITRVKHTSVMLRVEELKQIESDEFIKFKEYQGSVSSMRADSITALAIRGSRNQADTLIKEKKLFVNSKLITKKDYQFKPNDVFSIRGYGKFVIDSVGEPNSKGRFKVDLKIYQ